MTSGRVWTRLSFPVRLLLAFWVLKNAQQYDTTFPPDAHTGTLLFKQRSARVGYFSRLLISTSMPFGITQTTRLVFSLQSSRSFLSKYHFTLDSSRTQYYQSGLFVSKFIHYLLGSLESLSRNAHPIFGSRKNQSYYYRLQATASIPSDFWSYFVKDLPLASSAGSFVARSFAERKTPSNHPHSISMASHLVSNFWS
jgi:hypothetical protein